MSPRPPLPRKVGGSWPPPSSYGSAAPAGMWWWYPHWRRLQEEVTQFHSGTVLTKNECLHCDWICLNLKLWWCLVLGSAGSKLSSAFTGMLHLTILKSMASRISLLRSLRGAQFRSFSNEDTLLKRLWSWITNVAARRWMPLRVLMSLRYGIMQHNIPVSIWWAKCKLVLVISVDISTNFSLEDREWN